MGDQNQESLVYKKLLGIEPPKNYYELLGITPYETDQDAISNAADRQMGYLKQHESGQDGQTVTTILNQVSTARVTLLNKWQKTRYDTQIQQETAVAFGEPIITATQQPYTPKKLTIH